MASKSQAQNITFTNVMLGYLGLPEITEKTLYNGRLHTGDSGRMDDEVFVYIVDRVKDMIASGGENVYSIEVENAILDILPPPNQRS